MKIIQAMGMDSSKYGSMERFNLELAKQAKVRNDHIIFIYEEEPVISQFAEDIEKESAEIVIINSRKNPLSFLWKFIKLLRKEKPDVVHANFLNSRYIVVLISYLFRIPQRYQTIHGLIKADISWKTKIMLRATLKKAHIFTVSNAIKEQLVSQFKLGSTGIDTLYLGVRSFHFDKSVVRKKYNFDENTILLICIANYNHVKGLDLLIDTIEQLEKEHRFDNCKLLIVGQPDKDKAELVAIIKEKDLCEKVQLWGIRNDVPEILSMGDIYCQPSRSEGLPLSVMEALVAGLPVWGSTAGGIPEAVENNYNGFLFSIDDKNEMKEKLDILIHDKDLRTLFGKNSKEKSIGFEVEKGVKSLLDHYHRKE